MSKTVIVIGGGFAGMVAAAASARRGRKVTLLTNGAGSFPLNSGLIDILAYPASRQVCESPAAGIEQLPPGHPYRRIGSEKMQEAVDFFVGLSEQEGYPYRGDLASQQWVPTALGTLKPSGLVPQSMTGLRGGAETAEIVVAGFAGLKDYYIDLVADNISKALGRAVTKILLQTDLDGGRDLTVLDIARWLDTERGYECCRTQLASRLQAGSLVLLPQVFGTQPSGSVWAKFERDLACRFIESTGLPPSPNGLRLQKMMLQHLRRCQVEIVENTRVVRSVVEDGRCLSVLAETAARERSYAADSFILATGGFYGGGLQMKTFGQPEEPIFGIPIGFSATEENWAEEHLLAERPQPFAKAGIETDAQMRPLDATGACFLQNVFVAGRNLGGYDFCFEQSGNGVALVSAYQAAMSV